MKKHCSLLLIDRGSGISLILLAFMLLGTLQASAQAPKMFNFQGVARDASGKVVANAEIGYSFNIHEDSPAGQSVFAKEGYATTNSSGIFNVTIGTTAAPLPDVPWSSKSYYLQVGVDADGATNGFTFVDVGTTQLLSVPYALYANEAGKWRDDFPIIQKGEVGGLPIPPVGNGPTLLWHPDKAAFRAGNAINNYWNDASIGDYSFAAGTGTRAIGVASIAMGDGSAALANYTVALGTDAIASGPSSIALGEGSSTGATNATAIGNNTVANGNKSIALGFGTTAKSFSGIVTGNYNNISDNPSASSGVSSDRLFQIGNGTSTNSRSNAMTILRNGNIGIGNNVLTPEFIMDFGGRPRIRHNNATAGLFFDTSEGNPDGFVGMMTNKQIGFYLKDGWKLWTNDAGNCIISGAGYYLSSDIKLKTNISRITGSLSKLTRLSGYNYNWMDEKRDRGLLTGIIAQEIKVVLPELVSADENGTLAVNYTGLIPHLIEAVKELDQKTSEIAELKKELAEVRQLNKRMAEMEASLKTLLTGNTSAIGKPQTK